MELSLYELLYAAFLKLRSRKERGIFSCVKQRGLRDDAAASTRKFYGPVAERTREQRNAEVRYWRQRDSLHLVPQSAPTLYFDGTKQSIAFTTSSSQEASSPNFPRAP